MNRVQPFPISRPGDMQVTFGRRAKVILILAVLTNIILVYIMISRTETENLTTNLQQATTFSVPDTKGVLKKQHISKSLEPYKMRIATTLLADSTRNGPSLPTARTDKMPDKPYKLVSEELKQRRKDGYLDGIPLKFILNLTNYILTPKSPCQGHVQMIALVQSACANEDRRDIIRGTWGNEFKALNVPVVFFVGRCPRAEKEFNRTLDIVEADFVDSYHNLTLKSLTRYRWCNENCPKAEMVLMIDDDGMLNTEHLLPYVLGTLGYSVMGYKISKASIVRTRQSKWYLPLWALGDKLYPDYCAGLFYVVNGTAMQDLFEASLEIPFIGVDDALFTGYATEMIGLSIVHDERFIGSKDCNLRCGEKAHFVSHCYTVAEMKTSFEKRRTECGKTSFSTKKNWNSV